MKQTTFTGEEISTREFRRRRNQIEGPDEYDVWAGCMDEECGVPAKQDVTDEKGPGGLVKILCHCTCHNDPPEPEYVHERIAYPEDEGTDDE